MMFTFLPNSYLSQTFKVIVLRGLRGPLWEALRFMRVEPLLMTLGPLQRKPPQSSLVPFTIGRPS